MCPHSDGLFRVLETSPCTVLLVTLSPELAQSCGLAQGLELSLRSLLLRVESSLLRVLQAGALPLCNTATSCHLT